MKRTILAAIGSCALATASAPVFAQEAQTEELTAEEASALGEMFGDIFGAADPLTSEQELRVPAAMLVVSKLLPDGTMARMMDETMQPMMDSTLGNMSRTPAFAIAGLTGIGPLELSEVPDSDLEKALALLDPDFAARNAATNTAMFGLISEVMTDIEPAYRAGLARAYAVRFTQQELVELNAYFETPTGRKYAAESYLIYSDPQVMSAMNEIMPAVMERTPAIMEIASDTSDAFPAGRSYSDLTVAEQTRLAELLGVEKDTLAISEPEDDF